jgi:hypothetical protein
MNKRKKKYWNMTTNELADATQEFNQEGVAETFRPMSASEEAAWRAAVQKRLIGGTANGKQVKVVSLGIEADLLSRADALAKKRGISRAKLVAEGLEVVLAKSGT